MMEAMVVSALDSAKAAERYGLGHDQIILSAKVSGVRDLIDVYTSLAARCDYPLHLGLTEAGMGSKGADCLDGWTGAAAAGGHRRYDSREPDAEAGRRPHGRSAGGAADSAVALDSQLYAAGDELPRMRTHDEHVFPGAGRADSELSADLDAGVAQEVSRRGRAEAGGDGLRGERARRVEAREPGHQPAGHLRRSDGARCMWMASSHTTLRGDTIVAEFKQILDNYVQSHYGQGAKSEELVGAR